MGSPLWTVFATIEQQYVCGHRASHNIVSLADNCFWQRKSAAVIKMFLLLLLPSLSIAQYDMNPGSFGVMTNFHVASSLPKHQTVSYPGNAGGAGREVGKTNPRTPDQSNLKKVGLPTISFVVNVLNFNIVLGLEANSSAGPESELVFQVIVLQSKDLPDTDSSWLGLFDTSPDPHVRVALTTSSSKQDASTTTIWQQNNPEFHQSVNFQVERGSVKDGSLTLDVLDWDFSCYRRIGNVQVGLVDTGGATTLPLKLTPDLPCI